MLQVTPTTHSGARESRGAARNPQTRAMGLHHLTLSALEPELRTLVYVLVGVHLVVLGFWMCSLCRPAKPHEKTY